jgi:murein DD-endopeptidase MepM/ murein hydrolase activator NlpD
MRNGKRRWWYPDGYVAVAAANGVVSTAGNTKTGWRCWVDHSDGNRTGYFHGASLLVKEGDEVIAGDPVIVVGCNPNNYNAKHLHFEVSPIEIYAPKNPRVWLKDAAYKS